jgi:uncharacterized protein with HEPN domain
MKQSLSDELRVRHVLDAIVEIESYLQNVSLPQSLSNSEKRFATIKQLEIIGEACNRISSPIKEKYSEVEWNKKRPSLIWSVTSLATKNYPSPWIYFSSRR